MATLNYTTRLTNLQNRKFDRELNESLLSKSFSTKNLPDDVKYLLEAMRPIDKKYNDKTIEAANRVQKHVETGYNLHFKRAYRRQGSVMTSTNIKVHSDFDLLTIIDRYHYPEVSNGNHYTESDPNDDIKELRKQSVTILKNIYDEVDDSHEKCISIINKSLNRKVDLVFAYWYNSNKYEETKGANNYEYYRGIYLYKFPNGPRESSPDYPFAHISQVNYKGDSTNDGSRKGVRLLKTLKADCENELKALKSFHLTTIIHSINATNLMYSIGNELNLAKAVSAEMNLLLQDAVYRKAVKSPNGTEKPLENDELVPEIKRLKEDLDILIEDASKDVLNSATIKKALLTY
jgi:hypothetical protein